MLVFLKKNGDELSVAGLVQGKYIVENGEVRDISGEKVSLKNFSRRIEDAIPPHDAVTPVRTQAAQASPVMIGFEVVFGISGFLAI